METEPFKMDNLDDKSHLVDWKNYRLKKIIRETINDFISNNCFVPKKNSLIESIQKKLNGEKFKMWFGDWENDPKNASKVVDENGMPLVVYHGTTLFGDDGNPFTEFRFQKEGWNGGMNSPGYFTDSIAVAEFFANSDSNSMFRKKMYQVRKETNLNTIDDCVSFINQYFFGNADIIQRKMNSNDKLPIGVKKMVNQESLFLHTNSELGDLFLSYAEEGNAVIISRLHDRIKKLCDIADRQRYDKELSRGGVIYPCYLSIKKPFVYNANGKSFQLLDWEGFYEKAISNDCDGIIVQNVVETTLYNYVCTDYIVFNPNQIKHAYECVDFSSNSNIMK